jgi:hypothetical protein
MRPKTSINIPEAKGKAFLTWASLLGITTVVTLISIARMMTEISEEAHELGVSSVPRRRSLLMEGSRYREVAGSTSETGYSQIRQMKSHNIKSFHRIDRIIERGRKSSDGRPF